MSTPVSSGNNQPQREAYPHLSDVEWATLSQLAVIIGGTAVTNLLTSSSEDEQHRFINNFLVEQNNRLKKEKAALLSATPASRKKEESLKIAVSTYKGTSKESLKTWFQEVDNAIVARGIQSDDLKIHFAISCLGGQAKSWALGKQMLEDDLAFPSFQLFRSDMEATFEPPKCEFRARAEFLKVYQGKNDLRWYINRVRELVAMVTTSHIDEATKVVCFLQGLNDGPIKKHLFREYPDTLEKAISRALEEDFSAREAARARSFMGTQSSKSNDRQKNYAPRAHSSQGSSGPEPMDLSAVSVKTTGQNKGNMRCHRCQKMGHLSYECRALKPVPRTNTRPGKGYAAGRGEQPKNGTVQ